LSSSDFPALIAESISQPQPQTQVGEDSPAQDREALDKAERKAAKKAAAAERAAERQRIAQEKAAMKASEKAKIAQEKAAEKEKAAALKLEKEILLKEKIESEKAEKERLRAAQMVADLEREKAVKMKQEDTEKAAHLEKDNAGHIMMSVASNVKTTKTAGQKPTKHAEHARLQKPSRQTPSKQASISQPSESAVQAPLLSKMPKKNKPVARPIRISKEDDMATEGVSTMASATALDAPNFPTTRPSVTVESSASNSRAQSLELPSSSEPTSIAELLEEIDIQNPTMDLPSHPFFDTSKINPAAKMPLEYGPLVHALSALSVGGGSFANNMPSGSIDNAVSSFQQLLETLTQTISDLLRLLPRTTWDDSSSFDGVLRDMLKGDDFLDDGGGEDSPGKEDEVAALTLALERRARWMEVQLSKLEELHRDINTAAVRAVLSFNDSGWDRHSFMPRVGNTLHRFDTIGMAEGKGGLRPMTADELEKKLAVAQEAAVFAEAEVREVMEKMAAIRPYGDDEEEDDDDEM
jgi:CCR4-NOT transcription complex subunit 4